MKKTTILLVSMLLVGFIEVHPENIYSLIKAGKLVQAADSLSELSTASIRDGNRLFLLSLLEEDASQSARLMEASLKSSVSVLYRQEIYYRLAQYYYIKGDYTLLGQLVNEYLAFWEDGEYRREMLRLSVVLDENDKAFDAAVHQADRYLLEYNQGEVKQWGMVDKARIMQRFNKNVGAHNLLRKLSREKSGPGVAQALYLLALESIKKRRTDDAVFYYNLLREGYPAAVGLDAIVEKLANLSSSYDQDNTAEKLTGTFYSVQVGVFSVKKNSKKQAAIFKKYDKKVEIKTKIISNVKYHVVYVGRFSNYNDAYKFKKKLEANHNEVYQVIAR